MYACVFVSMCVCKCVCLCDFFRPLKNKGRATAALRGTHSSAQISQFSFELNIQ